MQRRPKTLEIFGYFLMAVAFSFPVQIMLIYGHGISELEAVFQKITFLNWLVIGAALVNSALIFRAAPALKVTMPIMVILMVVNNWVVGRWHVDYSQNQAMIASGVFVMAHGVLCRKSVLELFRHPENRWWLRAPRKQVEIQAYISPFNGTAFKAKTFDLSENGIFIPMADSSLPERGAMGVRNKKIGVNDRMTLCLTLGLAQIRCDAKVVRSVDARGNYPAGLGISFDNLGRRQLRELRKYIEATA